MAQPHALLFLSVTINPSPLEPYRKPHTNLSARYISHVELIGEVHITVLWRAIGQHIIAKQAQCGHVFEKRPTQTHVHLHARRQFPKPLLRFGLPQSVYRQSDVGLGAKRGHTRELRLAMNDTAVHSLLPHPGFVLVSRPSTTQSKASIEPRTKLMRHNSLQTHLLMAVDIAVLQQNIV